LHAIIRFKDLLFYFFTNSEFNKIMGCTASTRTPKMLTRGNFNEIVMKREVRLEDFPLQTINEEFSDLEQSQNVSKRNSMIKIL